MGMCEEVQENLSCERKLRQDLLPITYTLLTGHHENVCVFEFLPPALSVPHVVGGCPGELSYPERCLLGDEFSLLLYESHLRNKEHCDLVPTGIPRSDPFYQEGADERLAAPCIHHISFIHRN